MLTVLSSLGPVFPDAAPAVATAPPWWVPAITTAMLTSLGSIAATLATVSASARRAVELELRKQQLDIEKQRSDVSFRRQVEWCEGAISEATALLDASVALRTEALHVPTTGEQAEALIARAQSFDATLPVLRARTTTALVYIPP